MSTLRDDILPVISDAWQLVNDLGFSPYTVTVRTRTWSEGQVQLGTPTISDLVLIPSPDIAEMDGDNSLKVSAITPAFAGGGYTVAQLNPAITAGVETYYIVDGPNGSNAYSLRSIDSSDSVEYKLVLDSLNRKRPF